MGKAKKKITNWAEYNKALCKRGSVTFWIDDSAVDAWRCKTHHGKRGRGFQYSDTAIETALMIKGIFSLPLRALQGFIDSIFELLDVPLTSPDYTCISKRSKTVMVKYRNKSRGAIRHIAIDSTGLKEFGKGEWHQEKHKVNAKRSWKKAHFVVGDEHIIHGATLTKKDTMDFQVVEALCGQVDVEVDHVSADKMYDTNDVYDALTSEFPESEIAIPPKENLYAGDTHNPKRMSNLVAYFALGPMRWQKTKQYGKRNVSENAMHRYKTMIGPKLHSRDFNNQQQEMMLAASILNRFTQLGMPDSYRVAQLYQKTGWVEYGNKAPLELLVSFL